MVNLDPGYFPKPEAAFEEISARGAWCAGCALSGICVMYGDLS
jgi:hypothetical protein